MSSRQHARRGTAIRLACGVLASCLVALAGGTIATAQPERSGLSSSSPWAWMFELLRPAAAIDGRSVIVAFDDESLAELEEARGAPGSSSARQRRLAELAEQQDERLETIHAAGIGFDLGHRYLRTFNGVELRLHDDTAARLAQLPGVASVHRVRLVYPATEALAPSTDGSGSPRPAAPRVDPAPAEGDADPARREPAPAGEDADESAAGEDGQPAGEEQPADEYPEELSVPATPPGATPPMPFMPAVEEPEELELADAIEDNGLQLRRGGVLVALLDSGVDFNHPALSHLQAGPAWDVTVGIVAEGAGREAAHGTATAGVIAAAAAPAGQDLVLHSVRVLAPATGIAGAGGVVGTSADLIAGIEHAVDPNHDGDLSDAADVVVAPVVLPWGDFREAPEARAARGAHRLGTVVVTAAGNDGRPQGAGAGTVGGLAAADEAITVGAVDLRTHLATASLHLSGGGLDLAASSLPLLSDAAPLPAGSVPVVAIDGDGDDPVDYLDRRARSVATGAAVIVDAPPGVQLLRQARAAADAGAVALLVGEEAAPLAGTVGGATAPIPVVAVPEQLRTAARGASGSVAVRLEPAADAPNPAFGRVPGFSSGGPGYDGSGRIDIVAPGVGTLTAAPGSSADGVGNTVVLTGTSAAAADAGGRIAVLRAMRPGLDADAVRARVVGTAGPLVDGEPLDPFQAGAGLLRIARAADAELTAAPATAHFGRVAPGEEATVELGFRDAGGTEVLPPLLELEQPPAASGVRIASRGDGELVAVVDAGAPAGSVGGIISVGGDVLQVPWTIVVDPAAGAVLPVAADLTAASIVPTSRANDHPARLLLRAGIDGQRGVLAARAIRVVAVPNAERDDIAPVPLATLSEVLPGTYVVGISGTDGYGSPLRPGLWKIVVEVMPEGVVPDPDADPDAVASAAAGDPGDAGPTAVEEGWVVAAELALRIQPVPDEDDDGDPARS